MGGGGGAARGASTDLRLSGGGWLGIGGGPLGAELEGIGGGKDGGASVSGDLTDAVSSKLDSR